MCIGILLNLGVYWLSSALVESKGPVVESYGHVSISRGFPNFFYDVNRPSLSEQESHLSDALTQALTGKVALFSLDQLIGPVPAGFVDAFSKKVVSQISSLGALERMPSNGELEDVIVTLSALLMAFFPKIRNSEAVSRRAIEDSIGFGLVSELVQDPGLEEVMVNGLNRSVFVVHRRYGTCKTNVLFSNHKSLLSLVQRIGRFAGKPFDDEYPLLDCHLPDGSRVNATSAAVSPQGTSLTIRKFSRSSFSVVDLINHQTLSSDLAAFLWVMVEGFGVQPMNIIVTGGTGSGKTTTLNCLASFIPATQRLVSIEDTLELDLGTRENWVALESRPQLRSMDAVSMEELLQNALRMRPDRLVVGEVRGGEASTLFVAMDTGHDGTIGSCHANSAKELLLRLRSPPMNVPESMLGLLDLVVVQQRLVLPGKGLVRRVSAVAEISAMDEKPLLSALFEWNRKTDLLSRTDTPSHVLQVLSDRTSLSMTEIKREISVRKQVLEWMVDHKVWHHDEVNSVIQRYYADPQSVVREILGSKK